LRFSKKLKKGIFLSNGNSQRLSNVSEQFKNLGFKVGHLDEEGPISFFDKVNLKERYSEDIKHQVDYFVFNGINDIKKINKKFLFNKKYFIMGNPKYDIIKNNCKKTHSKQINLIKQKYKIFCLLLVILHYLN